MSRPVWLAVLAVVPVLLGLGAAALFQAGWLPNYLFVGQYHADLAALVSAGGALLGLALGLAGGGWVWAERRATAVRADQLQSDAASRRRFLQRLDHELKNPLTVIGLGLSNLQQQPALSRDPSLARIGQQAQRLQKLVKDLRALGELEDVLPERSAVPLAEVLAEAAELAQSAPDRAGRAVAVNVQQLPWPLPPVLGDRDLLLVVFSNLLDNALKYTRPDGRVEVRASEDARQAVVEVADNGLGIPAADLDHVFDELYRADNVRETPGSGVGLALVRRIIALHHGAVAIRSRQDQGTVVTVRLPLAE